VCAKRRVDGTFFFEWLDSEELLKGHTPTGQLQVGIDRVQGLHKVTHVPGTDVHAVRHKPFQFFLKIAYLPRSHESDDKVPVSAQLQKPVEELIAQIALWSTDEAESEAMSLRGAWALPADIASLNEFKRVF
jgi:hypothetical protein